MSGDVDYLLRVVVPDIAAYDAFYKADPVFRAWADTNLTRHRNDQYAIVTISLKAHGQTPGDATSDQMRLLADLAETYGHSDLRISHEQNVILPHVHKSDLPALHAALVQAGLGTANVGLLSDIIACPGMDYCALATARSIPVAQRISEREVGGKRQLPGRRIERGEGARADGETPRRDRLAARAAGQPQHGL